MNRSEMNVNMYSPDGRIIQIEYAMKAMNHGTITVAGCTKDSILIISEKKIINKLQVTDSIKKNQILFENIGLSFSGIKGDAKKIVEVAREICLNHFSVYHENISIIGLLKHLGNLALQFSEEENKKILGRPFGASIILGAVENIPKLYMLDPSGSYYNSEYIAIGSGHDTINEALSNTYDPNISFDNLMRLLLKNVGSVMQDSMTSDNVEVMVIERNSIKHLTKEEIKTAISAIK
ncbi:putative proteasome subunit alpha type-5 [Cucumispora dikerogammari]|nr:putative proteasome subunit alpha type-5 [Cucumispora dikerogammari]